MRIIILCCILFVAAGCTKKTKKIDMLIEPKKEIEQVEKKKEPLFQTGVRPKPVETPLQPITVYFDLDSYKIRPSEEVRLQEAAIEAGSKRVIVSGYACPLGTDIYNLELSRSRAEAVAQFFENHSARGYGETDLVSRETSEYWKNRRVEVRVE